MNKYNIYKYSPCLNRNMNINVYGHYGTPILVFPCQNSMSNDFENFGMIDTLSDYIEQGKIKVFCVDSIDSETWSNKNGDPKHRTWLIEQYYYYIINEVLPIIYENCGNQKIDPIVMGCSMGANHALNFFLRRPDLFKGVLAMSGVFDSVNYFFNGYCDTNLYNNCPEQYLRNLDNNHYYINLYNQKKIILSVGQGSWEEGLPSVRYLDYLFRQKGINAWVDYWGYDVSHDWQWWRVQIRHFLPHLL